MNAKAKLAEMRPRTNSPALSDIAELRKRARQHIEEEHAEELSSMLKNVRV